MYVVAGHDLYVSAGHGLYVVAGHGLYVVAGHGLYVACSWACTNFTRAWFVCCWCCQIKVLWYSIDGHCNGMYLLAPGKRFILDCLRLHPLVETCLGHHRIFNQESSLSDLCNSAIYSFVNASPASRWYLA